MSELIPMIFLVLPLAVGGLAHGIAMKLNLLSFLAVGYFLFAVIPGLEKVRQLFFPSATAPSLALLGMAVGAAAMLSELPNSFLKRQLNVGSGQAAPGLLGWAFYGLDQVDLLFGFWLVMAFAMPVTLERILISVALIFVGHQLVTVIGYGLGMRKTFR